MCLFFVGCGTGGPGGDDPNYQSSVDGVKVLARTTDDNYFSTATGKFSEYFYNIFSTQILSNLYDIYNDTYTNENEEDRFSDTTLDKTFGKTFGDFVGDDETNKYYLYDSLRYTISDVTITEKEGAGIVDYAFTLDLGSAWNWGIDYDAEYGDKNKIAFLQALEKVGLAKPEPNQETLKVSFANMIGAQIKMVFEDLASTPSYSEIYAGTEVKKEGEEDITDYFTSPYYQINVQGMSEITAKNYYQDALEYATYLFVLGYDYQDENGNPTQEAAKFDFEITRAIDGSVQGISVDGLSIETALTNVKEEYEKTGNFVGLTATNKNQIKRFVLDKIIGAKAVAKNNFNVVIKNKYQDSNGVNLSSQQTSQTLSFNRNYEPIVEYIIDYACTQAPIGVDADGNEVNLDGAYMASTITDYKGEYFFSADDGEGNMFRYIDPAEYQSMVFYPIQKDVGKKLTDIRLSFEYNDYEGQALSAAEDGLKLLVGLRYFDSETGTYTYSNQDNITVKKGENSALTKLNPDLNTMHFTEDDLIGGGTVKIDKDIVIGSQFKNPDAINPAKQSTNPDSYFDSMTIKGNSSARDYYSIIDAGTSFYGVLNGDKFSDSDKNGVANENACDFVEVFFCIQKGRTDVSYNFKVAVDMYYTMDVNM